MTTTPDLMNGSGLRTRQKRVMPSRSRRGGPGIGSTDVDVMILDTQKRKFENEPLIPTDTKFLLTTNSSFIPSSSSSSSAPFELELNSHAYERYFDRPDVLESYKAQLTIQTPEFSNLTEDKSVGGRFRPRIHEDDIADTSDAAYEKRHRKYETFEKRQRLREKEKLKHEQYKLKERMEQLRAMDGSAFLSLPSSSFPPAIPDNDNVNSADVDDMPGAHANGAPAYNEGERRRKEMLNVAMSLEERYRILLPPDKKHLERLKQNANARTSESAEPDVELEDDKDEDEDEVEVEELAAIAASNKQGEKLKLKIKFTPSREESIMPAESTSPSVAVAAAQSRRKRPTISPTVTKNAMVHRSQSQALVQSPSIPSSFSPIVTEPAASPPSPPQSTHPEIATLDTATAPEVTKTQWQAKHAAEPVPRPRPHKRLKETVEPAVDGDEDVEMLPHVQLNGATSKPTPPPPIPVQTSISAPPARAKSSLHHRAHSHTPKPGHTSHGSGTATNMERTSCLLMVSAMRTANAPLSRKTQRHVTAFGVKVPDNLDEIKEFELPWWILPDDDDDDDDDDDEQVQGTGPPPAHFELPGASLGVSHGGRHVKSQGRVNGGDVEFRRFLEDTQQDSEQVAASALLQL